MRIISSGLGSAQIADSRIPAIRISINGVYYNDRLLQLEHIEEAYRDRAVIYLSNSDRSLDDTDFTGQEFSIAYGYYTGNNVVEPNGNNAGSEYAETANVWVKSQRMVSCMGELACQLDCEGQWTRLRETKIIAYGTAPYYQFTFNEITDGYHIYEISRMLIEDVMGWALNDLTTGNDGIINMFFPVLEVNSVPFESAAEVLYRLILMTKMYLRSRANNEFEWVYPGYDNIPKETFHSDATPFFTEFDMVSNILVPNNIVVVANAPDPPDPPWPDLILGIATDPDSIAVYGEIIDIVLAGSIDNLSDANTRAEVILERTRAEQSGSRIVLPYHDCRLELYDWISVEDNR